MPALTPTQIIGEIVWIGIVPDRKASLLSQRLPSAELTFAGIPGEAHGGLTRPSCSRVSSQYPDGTTIRNVRQLSVMSAEQMAEIAAECGIDGLDPALIGASLVVSGIPDFTHLPPSSRLQAAGGATLVVDMENRPCTVPIAGIEAAHPGHGRAFKTAAKDKRGVTAWVEREGQISVGDAVRLHVPDQRAWRP